MELLLIFVPQEKKLVDENGNFRKEFLGMEGYAAFAEKYYESRMQQSFTKYLRRFKQEGDG